MVTIKKYQRGSYFFAGDAEGIRCFCKVTEADKAARVINGAYDVKIDLAANTIHIPYSDVKFDILLAENPPDTDYNAAIGWAEARLKCKVDR